VPDGKPDMAKKTLTRWKQLGLFLEVGEQIQLHPDLARIGADDVSGLRAFILRLILAPENNTTLTSEGSEDNERSRASDITRAISWALAQDPYTFPAKYKDGVESLQAKQKVEPRPFTNDTRWAGFAEWAGFLGVGWNAAKLGIVLDPFFAVRVALHNVFSGTTELPQETFLTRLAETLPIVDGGRYRTAVEKQIMQPWIQLRPNQISPSLSAALLSLEAKKDIRIDARSDAPQRFLLGRGGGEIRPISHVVRAGGS